ncbi:dTDP-4-amino-4,6-dideoxygalactose transaminase [Alkalispirillum mobile]|uniref:dTDP-4-amino-4,6-dideoxygalactose transaminase n=1 Tax=Alkalispirillum mobile TaxID=85925 RepID=A0A498BXC5_9GAMM|nr:DegT/DnrJ/EryC1/StrS family aminotransferase [Alkalispirillum mobile]RLK48374.1 dTDP-4-amino-4,6-dideoxygalactose transaminase [Alkalispirillum mobile]
MRTPVIPVTKPFLPRREMLERYIDGIYERAWLTNNGPLVQKLTERLKHYLGVENLLLVANGTLALQIAYKTLGLTSTVNGPPPQAITTPFTFMATTSSLKWEGIDPVFVDIDRETWNLDPAGIASVITKRTKAIVPVHVFGNPCNVEEIHNIARKHNLKVIYDAAHSFGTTYRGECVLNWGDAATLSFHATKVFHTIEGGAVVFKRAQDLEYARKLINFGLPEGERREQAGINAKMNEFQAAMGLCVLDEMESNLLARKTAWEIYNEKLRDYVTFQSWANGASNNYAYFPVLLESRTKTEEVEEFMNQKGIFPRRYFHPSLDTVFSNSRSSYCPTSQDIANRVLCLPLYASAPAEKVVSALRESICKLEPGSSRGYE